MLGGTDVRICSGASLVGLGLCIAKTIAEAHGGRIEGQSTPGAGRTFTLHPPLIT